MRRIPCWWRLAAALVFVVPLAGTAGAQPTLVETPALAQDVAAGKVPPIGQRVPQAVDVIDLRAIGKSPGKPGGELRLLLGKQKDTKMMMVYGYARLIAYNKDLEFIPDILEKFEVRDEREFTFHLRKGHRWSDGHPFTTEDFRYFWEDVAGNKEITRKGLPQALLVDGKGPTFEILDETTVRYTWHAPNPEFIPWITRPRPLLLYRPAHYLKQFHIRYGNKEKIQEMCKAESKRNWVSLHEDRDAWYEMDNPDLPTLQPWHNTTKPPSERFVFVRNPFYHRVDAQGNQLPYIDRVIVSLSATAMVPPRSGSGEVDLQARYLRFDHYTFLKASEERYDFSVRLWRMARGSQIALFPNLNTTDPVWRNLLREAEFRRALSIAINRPEINQVIYYGLAVESQDTVLKESPLYKEAYRTAWTSFNISRANRMLDDLGLKKRNEEGLRLLPDGRPMYITVETSGESTEQTDVLELVRDSWRKIGVKLLSKPTQREVFRQRIYAGDTIMSVWSGVSNGIPTASMSPEEFVPSSKLQYQWPLWGHYAQTGGKAGEAPALPSVKRLVELNDAWLHATDRAEKMRIWHEILQIHADNVFVIGIVNGTMQPVVINNRLRNIPEEGIYNWHPGAYFGIYRPETFWFAQ